MRDEDRRSTLDSCDSLRIRARGESNGLASRRVKGPDEIRRGLFASVFVTVTAISYSKSASPLEPVRLLFDDDLIRNLLQVRHSKSQGLSLARRLIL